MSLTALIIGGVLELAIICVSLYGAATLPPGAQVPVHFGPAGYNRWVTKNVGLTIWPVIGAVVLVIIASTVHSGQTHGGPGAVIGLGIALGLIPATEIGALMVATGRKGRD